MKSTFNMVKCSFLLEITSVILIFMLLTSACSHSDDEPKDFSAAVTINPDGSTSNGAIFIPLSDDTFYLDYVKYKIVDAHLEVVGVDKEKLKKRVSIYSPIAFNGFTYNTRKIGMWSFQGCRSLVSVIIPDHVTYIGYSAFSYCESLVSVRMPNAITLIEDDTFFGCKSLVNITIPDNVTNIGSSTFFKCESLKNVNLPKNLIEIGMKCFYNCESLEDLEFPDKIQLINAEAFAFCKSLENIIIPGSCLFIKRCAFQGCDLKMVKLPNSLQYYNSSSVFNNSKIENVEAHLSHWSEDEINSFFKGADITNLKIY